MDAARAGGDCSVAETRPTPMTAAPPQEAPSAVAVNVTTPAPTAEKVQVKLCDPPGGRLSGPGGVGPVIVAVNARPGPTAMSGTMLSASSSPVFVTVSTT